MARGKKEGLLHTLHLGKENNRAEQEGPTFEAKRQIALELKRGKEILQPIQLSNFTNLGTTRGTRSMLLKAETTKGRESFVIRLINFSGSRGRKKQTGSTDHTLRET